MSDPAQTPNADAEPGTEAAPLLKPLGTLPLLGGGGDVCTGDVCSL